MLPESGYWLASRDERIAEYIAVEPPGADPAFVSATMEQGGGRWKLGWLGPMPAGDRAPGSQPGDLDP